MIFPETSSFRMTLIGNKTVVKSVESAAAAVVATDMAVVDGSSPAGDATVNTTTEVGRSDGKMAAVAAVAAAVGDGGGGGGTEVDDYTETGLPVVLLWLPYTALSLVLVALMIVSFVRFHCKHGYKYRQRHEQAWRQIDATDLLQQQMAASGSGSINGSTSSPLFPVYHHHHPHDDYCRRQRHGDADDVRDADGVNVRSEVVERRKCWLSASMQRPPPLSRRDIAATQSSRTPGDDVIAQVDVMTSLDRAPSTEQQLRQPSQPPDGAGVRLLRSLSSRMRRFGGGKTKRKALLKPEATTTTTMTMTKRTAMCETDGGVIPPSVLPADVFQPPPPQSPAVAVPAIDDEQREQSNPSCPPPDVHPSPLPHASNKSKGLVDQLIQEKKTRNNLAANLLRWKKIFRRRRPKNCRPSAAFTTNLNGSMVNVRCGEHESLQTFRMTGAAIVAADPSSNRKWPGLGGPRDLRGRTGEIWTVSTSSFRPPALLSISAFSGSFGSSNASSAREDEVSLLDQVDAL